MYLFNFTQYQEQCNSKLDNGEGESFHSEHITYSVQINQTEQSNKNKTLIYFISCMLSFTYYNIDFSQQPLSKPGVFLHWRYRKILGKVVRTPQIYVNVCGSNGLPLEPKAKSLTQLTRIQCRPINVFVTGLIMKIISTCKFILQELHTVTFNIYSCYLWGD